jgi:PAS domain S-box-containing protein
MNKKHIPTRKSVGKAVKKEIKKIVPRQEALGVSELRKKLNLGLEHSINFYEDIVETIRNPLLVLDSDLRVLFANLRFYATFKVNARETVGNLVYDLGNRQWNIPGLRTLLEEILPKKNRFNDYQLEHDFPAIGKRIMLLNARRITNLPGEQQLILLAIEDVTDRMRIEKALLTSEERFRGAFENASDSILLIDKITGRILNSNRAALELLGYSKTDIQKLALSEFGFIGDAKKFQTVANQLEETGILTLRDTTVKARESRWIPADIILTDRTKVIQCNIRNITERKNTQEVIRDSEQRLALIFDTVGDVLFLLAVEPHNRYRFESVNQNFLTVTGLKREQVEGKLIQEVLPSTAHALVLGNYRQAIHEKKTIRWEEASEYPTGKLYGDVSVTPAFNSAGVCTHLIGSVHDITELKKSEEKIRILSRFPDENPNPVMRISSRGEILFANPASGILLQMWGRKVGQVLPRAFKKMVLEVMQNKQNKEVEITCGERIFSILLAPIVEENYINFYSRDITDRKQIELKLKHNEKRVKDITENAQEWIWEIDAAGKHTYTSPMVEKLLGYTTEEILQKYIYDLFHPEDREALKAAQFEYFAAKKPYRDFINRNMHKNGQDIWLSTSAMPILDDRGNLFGFRGADTDITSRKQVEAVLQESETRYRGLFEDSPISLWEEDFSAVKARLDALKAQGITDMRAYLKSHPHEVVDCFALIRILGINKATVMLFKARNKDDLMKKRLDLIVASQLYQNFFEELICISEGQKYFDIEEESKTLTGELINIHLSWSASPGHEDDLSKVIVSITDITEHKRAEVEIKSQLNELQRWHKITLGRETHILDLKHEVNELLDKANQPPRYPSAEPQENLEK